MDRHHPSIKREDWDHLGYNDNDGPSTINLSGGEHHQRFNRSKWKFQGDQSAARFKNVIQPIVRLATKILFSPGSVQYIYWLLYGPREELSELSRQRNTPIRCFRPLARVAPFEEMKQKVDTALNNLSEYTEFSLASQDIYPDMADTHGSTKPETREGRNENIRILDAWSDNGTNSYIRINEAFFTLLENLYRDSNANAIQIFNATFNCAKTICHELVHSFYMATEPAEFMYARYVIEVEECRRQARPATAVMSKPMEMMFKGEGVSELGYSWENHVFGGRVQWDHHEPNQISRFFKWPSFLSGEEYLRQPGKKRSATIYYVPKHYLQNIHQDAFWDRVLSGHFTALRIEKSVGLSYEYGNEPGEDDVDPDWDTDTSSEGRWPPLEPESARVFRQEPDPSATQANRPFNLGLAFRYARRQ